DPLALAFRLLEREHARITATYDHQSLPDSRGREHFGRGAGLPLGLAVGAIEDQHFALGRAHRNNLAVGTDATRDGLTDVDTPDLTTTVVTRQRAILARHVDRIANDSRRQGKLLALAGTRLPLRLDADSGLKADQLRRLDLG